MNINLFLLMILKSYMRSIHTPVDQFNVFALLNNPAFSTFCADKDGNDVSLESLSNKLPRFASGDSGRTQGCFIGFPEGVNCIVE